ncbi:TlpA family protein disulfide reductase [Aquimarina brevivitae]|uniref:Thiol-disulfide isomerase/thioredoxin n=1 Tax=Aquimarina brevivitae TaxID=323412 RepID=A0A4Q7NXR5_9FLAO|nr:TlpA disulfide reductase family protein [Aquimarina brevivitae]RZS92027.1 thiol-disulfide isomerase/thioredoxin [Aquimarina brevivitae]
MNKVAKFSLLGILFVLLAVYIHFKYFSVSEGQKAPDFKATLVDGTQFQLSDLKGNYVLLDFWGSWCGPCIKELPKLVQLANQEIDDLRIVTVALEKDPQNWQKVEQRFVFNWKNQIVETAPIVLSSPIARKYGVTEIPSLFLIDPDGILVGEFTIEELQAYDFSN